jgi:hypothetical protein
MKRPPPSSIDPRRLADEDLESLLMHGQVRDARRERIIDDVLRQVGRGSPTGENAAMAAAPRAPSSTRAARRWRSRTPALAAVTLIGVAALALAVWPRSPRQPAWGDRGGGPAFFGVEVGCSRGTLDHCPIGSTLLFRVQDAAPAGGGYLIAFAEPSGGDGQRIWYLSGQNAPALPAHTGSPGAPILLAQGARIGAEHRPGLYILHTLVARRPLDAAEVLGDARNADVVARHDVRLVVVAADGK